MDYTKLLGAILGDISATEFIAFVIAACTLGTAVFLSLKKIAAWHENYVINKLRLKETQEKSEDIAEKINKLSSQIGEIDQCVERIKTDIDGYKTETKQEIEQLRNAITDHRRSISDEENEIYRSLTTLTKTVGILIKSDRSTILSDITNEYYRWSDKRYIPEYAMRNLEDQYKNYLAENGNHFAEDLMVKLRKLPQIPHDHESDEPE